MVIVYAVTCGCYSEQYLEGIYSSPEAAMAANPVRTILPDNYQRPYGSANRPGGWREDPKRPGHWGNGLDWDEAASIEPYEVRDVDNLDVVGGIVA